MQLLKQNFKQAKTCQKPYGKNLLKIPCGQKSVWISQKLLTIH